MVRGDRVVGAVTQVGIQFRSSTVVLTAGTFLDGKIHVGLNNYAAGRAGDPPAVSLSARLKGTQIAARPSGRPPRIDGSSINCSQCTEQPGDGMPGGMSPQMPVFSFMGRPEQHPQQMPCWITHTNERTTTSSAVALIAVRCSLARSEGSDRVSECGGQDQRFCRQGQSPDLSGPELDHPQYYPNGISTSLPFDIQYALVRSMAGLENAHILRPGYAIEYDYFDPQQLKSSFETRALTGLFLPGKSTARPVMKRRRPRACLPVSTRR